MDLWKAIYIAKNIKGFYLPCKEGVDKEIKFLRKRFRYRKIGILSTHLKEIGNYLDEPLYLIEDNEISCNLEYKEINYSLASLMQISSLFMVPILASPLLRDMLKKLFLWSICLERKFSPKEFSFNLRLLTYFMIDMAPKYPKAIKEKVASLELNKYIKEREDNIIKDAKERFWRLEENREGEIRLGIIEPFQFIKKFPKEDFPFLPPVGIIFIE